MELPKKEYIIVVLIALAVLGILILFLTYATSTAQPTQVDLNNSEVGVFYSACTSCTQQIPLELYNFFAQYGYIPNNVSIFFGDNTTATFISNNLITALPSLVIPSSIAQNSQASTIISALVYSNVFTSGANNFVLNTPFIAALTHSVTYYNILENRTMTSVNIYNISTVYNVTASSKFAPIMPIPIIMTFNDTNITRQGKPVIDFVYSDSPYSALQDFLFTKALENFGNFTGLSTYFSQSFQVTQTSYIGPQVYYNLQNASYNSNFFYLEAYNISDITDVNLSRQIFEYDQNALLGISTYGNFMPFIDIGGRFISVSSMLQPMLFNGMNITQINNYLDTNSTVDAYVNDSISFIDAMLCTYTGAVVKVCSSPKVNDYSLQIDRALIP